MADHPKTNPPPDALMFRDVAPGVWDIRRVGAHRIAGYLEAGWTILISEAQVRAGEIEDAYLIEQAKWNRNLKERL